MSAFAPSIATRLAGPILALLVACPALAGDPSELPEGPFAPLVVQAAKEGVIVRAEPGFLYRELSRLRLGDQVTVARRQGRWLGLRPEGWVSIDEVADVSESLFPEGPALMRVISDGVRLRSGPGTDHGIVGGRKAGDSVEVLEREGDWWRLAEGGWVHASLVEESAPSALDARAPLSPFQPRTTGQKVRRWSFMDLHGTMFEIFEVDPRTPFLAGLRQAMRETRVLEDDWTYLRLVISVPRSRYTFKYSPKPDGNPVSVWDRAGNRFGSVFAQGPVERIPMHLRGFFLDQTVGPGERFEGLLMFRPTLDARRIERIQMMIGGRPRSFYETP